MPKEDEARSVFTMTYLMLVVMAAVVVIGGGGVLPCALSHSAVSHELDGCLCPLQAASMRKHMGV